MSTSRDRRSTNNTHLMNSLMPFGLKVCLVNGRPTALIVGSMIGLGIFVSPYWILRESYGDEQE